MRRPGILEFPVYPFDIGGALSSIRAVRERRNGNEEHWMAATSPGSQNRLLRGLSREDYRSLAPHLKHVPLSLDDVLVERNKANHHVYFRSRD